ANVQDRDGGRTPAVLQRLHDRAAPARRLANRAGGGTGKQVADPGMRPHGGSPKVRGRGSIIAHPAAGQAELNTTHEARTVAATSPRHSVGTTKELSSNFSSSLIRSGKRRGSSATANTSCTPLVNLSRATTSPRRRSTTQTPHVRSSGDSR